MTYALLIALAATTTLLIRSTRRDRAARAERDASTTKLADHLTNNAAAKRHYDAAMNTLRGAVADAEDRAESAEVNLRQWVQRALDAELAVGLIGGELERVEAAHVDELAAAGSRKAEAVAKPTPIRKRAVAGGKKVRSS